jgi:cap1 methyltransferase
LYRWENVLAFSNCIQYDLQSACLATHKATHKVHLVVADGGFDAQRDSECQEELAQKLIICEIASGMHLLQQGGTLIVKMFGFQTTSVRRAMRSLYDYFEELVALKPISSRPASSERYVVCSGFRGVAHDWDGPRWVNSVLLGMTGGQDETHYSRLDKYLDDFDRDILSLNLKACFAILTCLERKAAANCAWHESEDTWIPERPHVNVNIYKHAWRLH